MSAYLGRVVSDASKAFSALDTSDFPAKERILLDSLHPKQRAFVLDPARRIAALVARRGGKTTGGRARFVRCLGRIPKAHCVYIGLSRPHAEELMWQPLKELIDILEIKAVFNETKLRMTLTKNQSQLQLVGADDKREIEKLRGQKFHEAGIDEGASHARNLFEALLFRILGPALTDFGGPLWTCGTPGHILAGAFYDITRPGSEISRPYDERNRPEYKDWNRWSTHFWSLRDNTGQPHLWGEAQREKEANGWSDDNSIWRREFIGQWVADDTGFVYKFRAHHPETGEEWNTWAPGAATVDNPFGLPAGHDWRYVYGLDLGWADPFTMVVLAYSETSKVFYQVYEYSKKGCSIREIAELLQGCFERTGYPDGIVADTAGLGGQVVAELTEVYGIVIEAADKKDKFGAIELLNSDLVDGRFKVLPESKLRAEMQTLQFDETGTKENKAQDNHHCDATIYARKKCGHQHSKDAAPPGPLPGTADALNQRAALEEQRAVVEEERKRQGVDGDWYSARDDDFTEMTSWRGSDSFL